MGTYATTTSLEILMVGTTFDTATTALASMMITKAENEIDKHLSRRYDVSEFRTNVPPLVRSLCETLAHGYTIKRKGHENEAQLEAGNDIVKEAMDNIKDIVAYKANLLDSSGSLVPESADGSDRVLSSTQGYTPTFAEDSELNWAVDPDKIDDIESERD